MCCSFAGRPGTARLPRHSKPSSCLGMGREMAGGPHFLRQGAENVEQVALLQYWTAILHRVGCC